MEDLVGLEFHEAADKNGFTALAGWRTLGLNGSTLAPGI